MSVMSRFKSAIPFVVLSLLAATSPANAADQRPTINLAAESDSGISFTDNVTNVTSPKLYGSAQPESTVAIYSGARLVGETMASSSGEWAKQLNFSVEGKSIYSLTAVTKGGRSSPLEITIDLTVPRAVSIVLDRSGDPGFGDLDAFAGDGDILLHPETDIEAGLLVESNGVELELVRRTKFGCCRSVTVKLPPGLNTVRGRNYSRAGNLSAPSNALTVLVPAEPQRLNLDRLAASEGVQIFGDRGGDKVGSRVAAAGDFNGDGYDDIVVGSGGQSGRIDDATPAAHVVFGGRDIRPNAWGMRRIVESRGVSLVCPEEQVSDSGATRLPHAVRASEAGDLNGDGVGDLVVVCFYLVRFDVKPTVTVVYGRRGQQTREINVGALAPDDGFRIVLPNAQLFNVISDDIGDVDGDRLDDLGLMTWGGPPPLLYVVRGSKEKARADVSMMVPDGPDGFRIKTSTAFLSAGRELNGLGDINGDGLGDFGYVDRLGGPAEAGETYVIFGTRGQFPPFNGLNGKNGFVVFNNKRGGRSHR